MAKIRLIDYFEPDNIITKDEVYPSKPSPKGLEKIKKDHKLKDFELMHIGDGMDDFVAAKAANVFFGLIAQGLISETGTILEMKKDASFGKEFLVNQKVRLPKFLTAFTFQDLIWWFSDFKGYSKAVKALSFDLGDTLIIGGREEAYKATNANWPTWEVDKLLNDRKVDSKTKSKIFNIKIDSRARKFGELPAMNNTESRVASLFLVEMFDLKEKDIVNSLYSEIDSKIVDMVEEISKHTGISTHLGAVDLKNVQIKDLVNTAALDQFIVYLAAGVLNSMDKPKNKIEDMSLAVLSALEWGKQYRKNEEEAYKKFCKVPKDVKEFLDLLTEQKKKLFIFTSKSRNIVEASLSYEKDMIER